MEYQLVAWSYSSYGTYFEERGIHDPKTRKSVYLTMGWPDVKFGNAVDGVRYQNLDDALAGFDALIAYGVDGVTLRSVGDGFTRDKNIKTHLSGKKSWESLNRKRMAEDEANLATARVK